MRAAVFFRIDYREDLPGYRDFPDLPDVEHMESDSVDPVVASILLQIKLGGEKLIEDGAKY